MFSKTLDGLLCIGQGYSGHGDGKNNPDMQNVRMTGPIPCGKYRIGAPYDHPHLGKYVMPLTAQEGTNTFGRDAFFLHGDNAKHPGEASDGCIVMPPEVRHAIGAAVVTKMDDELEVVSGLKDYGP